MSVLVLPFLCWVFELSFLSFGGFTHRFVTVMWLVSVWLFVGVGGGYRPTDGHRHGVACVRRGEIKKTCFT